MMPDGIIAASVYEWIAGGLLALFLLPVGIGYAQHVLKKFRQSRP